jgi:hypothetical protein
LNSLAFLSSVFGFRAATVIFFFFFDFFFFLNFHTRRAQTAEHQNYWRACALFVAGSGPMQRMLHGGDGRGSAFSLAALLRACDTRLVDLFEPLKSFVSFLNLGVQYEDLLRALEKQFVVSAILFQKYETCFAHLLRSNGDASVPSETERRQLFAFGWDLFLVVKSKLLAAPVDLIDAFHVLLCVVDVLLLHAPDRLRAISLDRIARVVADLSADAPDGAAPASPTLAYLCAHNRASYTDVRHVQLQMVNPLLAALRDNGILRHQPARLAAARALGQRTLHGRSARRILGRKLGGRAARVSAVAGEQRSAWRSTIASLSSDPSSSARPRACRRPRPTTTPLAMLRLAALRDVGRYNISSRRSSRRSRRQLRSARRKAPFSGCRKPWRM